MKTNNIKVSAGASALSLGVIGWLLRAALPLVQTPGRGLETASAAAVNLGTGSAILLLVAGLLGLYAVIKDDGCGPGVLAIVLSIAFAVTMFAAMSG